MKFDSFLSSDFSVEALEFVHHHQPTKLEFDDQFCLELFHTKNQTTIPPFAFEGSLTLRPKELYKMNINTRTKAQLLHSRFNEKIKFDSFAEKHVTHLLVQWAITKKRHFGDPKPQFTFRRYFLSLKSNRKQRVTPEKQVTSKA